MEDRLGISKSCGIPGSLLRLSFRKVDRRLYLFRVLRSLRAAVMAQLRAIARAKKAAKNGEWNDDVLDMSLTIGLRGADVCRSDIKKLDHLLQEHYLAGIIALKRGDAENRLHFQGVIRARTKSSLSFEVFVRKYLGWYNVKNMYPVRRVVCNRSLISVYIHFGE